MNAHTSPQEAPSFDPIRLRNVFGEFATGVTVITTLAEDGRPVGLAANSFSSLSLEPALVSWSLARSAPSLGAFRRHGHFAINILGEDSMDLALTFSRPAEDKFAGIEWRAGLKGVPVLSRATATLECETYSQIAGGDHEIFIGQVRNMREGEGRAPLLFFRGKFAQLGQQL